MDTFVCYLVCHVKCSDNEIQLVSYVVECQGPISSLSNQPSLELITCVPTSLHARNLKSCK